MKKKITIVAGGGWVVAGKVVPAGGSLGVNFLSPMGLGTGAGMLKLIPDPPSCYVY